jgi:hypothetical protein
LASSSACKELDDTFGLTLDIDSDPWRLRPFGADRPFFDGAAGHLGGIDVSPLPPVLSELRLVYDHSEAAFKLQAVQVVAAEQPLR